MPTMIRKRGKAEKIAYEILGTPINMSQKKYRGTVEKDDISSHASTNAASGSSAPDMEGILNLLKQGQ